MDCDDLSSFHKSTKHTYHNTFITPHRCGLVRTTPKHPQQSLFKCFLNFSAVSDENKHTIEELLKNVSQFNTNDVLVQCQNPAILPINWLNLHSFTDFNPYKQLIANAQKTFKEQGVFPLCIARGTIQWDFKQKNVYSPLLLIPCAIERNKLTNTVRFSADETAAFVNPFLVNRLEKEFGIRVPNGINALTELVPFLAQHGCTALDEAHCFIGNFHHHRFQIIKELEELLVHPLGDALKQLLGDESIPNSALPLGNGLLFPADNDQLAVFKSIEHSNTVIQGPPGTGKSQVLANVLGKLLEQAKSGLVVSEKRVALEVLYHKLGEVGLDDLCFVATSETHARDFLHALTKSWQRLERLEPKTPKPSLYLSTYYKEELQQQLRVLNQPALIGGVSFATFIDLTKAHAFEQYTYSSDLPDILTWQEHRETVLSVYTVALAQAVGTLTRATWQQHTFKDFDQQLNSCLNNLRTLKQHIPLETLLDLQHAMRLAALSQNFNTAAYRKHEKILTPNSKEQKRFIRLRKTYLEMQSSISELEQQDDAWKIQPTVEELTHLAACAKNNSLWGRLAFRRKWLKFSHLPVEFAQDRIAQKSMLEEKRKTMTSIKHEFYALGVEELHHELATIHHSIHLFTEADHREWQNISASQRALFSNLNAPLNHLYSQLNAFFRLEDTRPIESTLIHILDQFERLLSLQPTVQRFDDSLLRALKKYKDFNELEGAIFKSNWVRFTHQFPQFSAFNSIDLIHKCRTISQLMQEESATLSQYILSVQHQQFEAYHAILKTPNNKLDAPAKALKAQLKKGKAILVNEFSKSRKHLSIRELMASDARIWVQLLKPIWLSNPTQLAQCFPMEAKLFDCVVLDEASQLLLQHGLGAVQRATRVLVAGDEHQMGPSSYFSAQHDEALDLLHQASFYWKNKLLTHHYRSEHPALIHFSNAHFYTNQLLAFPSTHREEQPIAWHYIPQGVFEERKNEIEAHEVAHFLEQQLNRNESLGVVAFSETQLSAIYAQLSTSGKLRLEERMEENSLFFKALENVQGEECDRLIISLGYGKNAAGEFHHRFGPLNGKNGTRRLNVLLTRARRKIDFFSSVDATAFKLSDNEGVNLLRLFLQQLEDSTEKQTLTFPYQLSTKIHGKQLILSDFYTTLQDANQLLTYVTVLEQRGWEIRTGNSGGSF